MKINKAHLKWRWEASRGSSQSPTTLSVIDPNRKREIPCTKVCLTTLVGGTKILSLPAMAQRMKDCPNSANEKPLYFQLPVYTKRLFVYDNCSQLSPFLSKRAFLLFVLLTCLWFYCSLCVLNCISLLFPQINPFCWQTN